jgi:outer membrane protein TolC
MEIRTLCIDLGKSVFHLVGVGTYIAALSQPIFEVGYLRNNLRYARSEQRQALIAY